MMKTKILSLIVLLTMAILLCYPQQVSALSLFKHSETTVPVGQTVDDLYVVGGDAEIFGHATGIVIVINGSLHLAPTAHVDGAIVVIGGRITQDDGAAIGDDIYNITPDTGTQNSLLIGGGMVAGLWFVQLASSLLLIFIPLLFYLIGGQKGKAWVKRHPITYWRKPLYLGTLGSAILVSFSILCIMTIVGIPLLLIFFLIFLAAFIMGMTSLSYTIGGFFQEKWIPNEWVRLITGATLIVAFMNIPFVGGVLWLIMMVLSLGMFIQWLYSFRKKTK
ncbi:hypothetical protein [Paenibacillus riograndensis]|uniref:Uncharacterized protein n=1 Tax=Paenibacillus riograndensis SBR5 TaxID=1073571 RepID=A0A0E3WH46_9BACL|nr:hypothetical protein [Paenibacillus riograndensis]CQR54653.1 hypothetical protein PRIO_2244 [Paenibacillus riograndensis SBR5]